MNTITLDSWSLLPQHYTGHIKYIDGTQAWFKDGRLHREDGPAVIFPNDEQRWYQNDNLYREDGPAIVYSNGHQIWWLNDELFTKEAYYRELHRLGKITEQELFLELL